MRIMVIIQTRRIDHFIENPLSSHFLLNEHTIFISKRNSNEFHSLIFWHSYFSACLSVCIWLRCVDQLLWKLFQYKSHWNTHSWNVIHFASTSAPLWQKTANIKVKTWYCWNWNYREVNNSSCQRLCGCRFRSGCS